MGRRKKMWLCLLLWYALVYAEYAHSTALPSTFNPPLPLTTHKLSKAYRESENYDPSVVTGLSSNGETRHFHNKLHKSLPIVVPDEIDGKSRIGYEKDIMLVLPVKPNANDTDLQMWYTQKPITAIIDDRGVSKPEHRADYDVYEDFKVEEERHPYTNFLVKKMSSKPQKSPLDYGYPESFKFVEDLNGLPSNHKPEWASTDVTDLTSSSSVLSTTQLTTAAASSMRNNPFEMFESVKPLEINKFLSPSMIASMPESEEVTTEVKPVTESHIHTIPKRPSKPPTKKPQKTKLTTEATTTELTQPDDSLFSSQTAQVDPEQVYAAVRYTTLLKQTNKEFLPSFSHKNKPISVPSFHYQNVPTTTTTSSTTTTPSTTTTTTTEAVTTPRSIPTTTTVPTTTSRRTTPLFTTAPRRTTTTTSAPPSTTTTPTTTTTTATTTTTTAPSTTTTTTTTAFASSSLNDIAVYNVTEDVDDDPLLSESLDSIASQNLSNFQFQINHFEPPKDVDFFKPDIPSAETEPFKEINPNIPGDMLTNDMKNMLVALGILKSDQISTTSTTEKPFIRKEPVTPSIDADSYTSFKKIPDTKQPDKTGISDDMKDLLASFGLLPNKKTENETSANRISRQQNLTEVNFDDLEIHTTSPFNTTDSEISSLNPIFNGSQSNADLEADVADFFDNDKPITVKEKPIADVVKPMTLNSEMFPEDMKNTLETLGFLKQRSPKSAHVFQPTSQLEKLNQDDAAKKITDVLRTIKSLSVKTETNNITAEELEKQLQTITNTLESDSFNDVNDTLLLDILSNDTNLKLIESIDNMTSKFRPANKTWPVAEASTTTDVKVIPKFKTFSTTTTTEKVIQTIRPLDSSILQPEMKPPNPLSTEELLQLYEMGKNEIKRQQPNTTSSSETPDVPSTTITSSIDDTAIPGANTEVFNTNTDQPNILETSSASSTTSTTSSSASTTTAADDSKASANNNAPIPDLADSFGGGGVASEEPSADDLPTPKPNGLYFYLDWNTFLNVGEEDKRPIRIRFAPRAGNARNFLPITVP